MMRFFTRRRTDVAKKVLLTDEIFELIVEEVYGEGSPRELRSLLSLALTAKGLTEVSLRRLWSELRSPRAIDALLYAISWTTPRSSDGQVCPLVAPSHSCD